MTNKRLDRMIGLAKFTIAALADYHTRVAWTRVALQAQGVPETYRKNIIKVLLVQLGKLQEVVQELAKLLDQEFEELDESVGLDK